jgi:hypothetical protein
MLGDLMIINGLGATPPITCNWPQVAGQINIGPTVDATNPANWACGVTSATSNTESYLAFGGAVAALLLLPGWWKLAALPLLWEGVAAGITAGGGL